MPELLDVSGKCHCGRISLNGLVEPDMIIACHCTDCQTFSGAPFRAVVILKPENIVIKGDVSQYTKIADSGTERVQGFCGKCGTQIYAAATDKSVYNVRTGFLDQHNKLIPKKHIFGKSAAPWLSSVSETTWLKEGPNSEEMSPFGNNMRELVMRL